MARQTTKSGVKATERELASWLSDQINQILGQGSYPFGESTAEASLPGQTSLFPDITIWINRSANQAFAFMEIKPPGKIEERTRLIEVAERLQVNYAITWNFTEAELFRFDNGKLERKKQYPTNSISDLQDWSRADKKISLRKCLRDFLDDLKELSIKGHLHAFQPDKYFFIHLLQVSTDSLYKYFIEHLSKAMEDKKYYRTIKAFMAKQGIPDLERQETYDLLARHWAYGLLTKILFYLTIRRHFPQLPDIIKEAEEGQSGQIIISRAFAEARKIDWQAVFYDNDPIEEIGIPRSCNDALRALLNRLGEYNFGELKEDVIGEIFENLIPERERSRLGQYFTREDLVDFIIAFVAQSANEKYCDPTCGSGTFLNRLYSRLKYLGAHKKKHNDLLPQIWGIDIAKFPAELATINLFRHDVGNYSNFPRVQVIDFFDVQPGQIFDFPPPKANPDRFIKIDEPMPTFSGMVGNFPFIRQEQIEVRVKGYKNKLTKVIAIDWFREYPDIFKIKKLSSESLNKLNDRDKENYLRLLRELIDGNSIDLKLSGQADIYTYLFLHASKFLTADGRMGFITSNSYLDVSYGYELKKFFLDKFKIVAIVASWAEPWFDFASINTVFTILERCDNDEERKNHFVKFVKIKKKLEDLIPYRDLAFEEDKRWNHIEKLVNKIELAVPPQKKNRADIEDGNFRIRVIKQSELISELDEHKEFAKWGKYLRAPQIYFDILEKAKDNLIPLKEVADIRRGYTTGINDFFYLEPTNDLVVRKRSISVRNGKGWIGEIEEKFLKPVIKSPKEADSIIIDPTKLKYKLFLCNMSKSDLKRAGHLGALHYIEWAEKQKTKEGIKWPEVSSVSGRQLWWDLGKREPFPIFMQMVNNDRFVVFRNEAGILADHNLFEMNVEQKYIDIVLALLNSTFTALNREVISRINLGDGATKTEGIDWSNNVLIFDPRKIASKESKIIIKAFSAILDRKIEPMDQEIKIRGRIAFDKAVFETFDLASGKLLLQVYKGISDLINERLSLPKMRKKVTKAKVEFSIQQIKKQVEAEILADGLRRFPDSFIENIPKSELLEIPTSGLPLKIGGDFFGRYEILDESGQKIYDADGLNMARHIAFSYHPNEYIIMIPKNRKLITKCIQEYERYIKSVFQKLAMRAMSATQSHHSADRVAIEILSDNGYCGNFDLS